jgi:hypothetical protein
MEKTMTKKTKTRRYSLAQTIALVAEADKSNPFASRRIAADIRKHGVGKNTAKDAERAIQSRKGGEYIKDAAFIALADLKQDMLKAAKPKTKKRKPKVSMSMFVSKKDMDTYLGSPVAA